MGKNKKKHRKIASKRYASDKKKLEKQISDPCLKEESEQSKKKINKLLIVGHRHSNIGAVEEVLHAGGMQPASDLQKEGVPASQLSEIIVSASCKDFDSTGQLSVSPVWNGLALDLMMSNRNKKLWGWSDSKAISLLNYWKSIDSNMAFVLVYSSPSTLIKNMLDSYKNLSREFIDREVKDWSVYNKKLLDFYFSNNDSAILMNSDQAANDSMSFINTFKKKLLIGEISTVGVVEKVNDNCNDKDPLKQYLFNSIIKENDSIIDTYQELQLCANFPNLHEENLKSDPIDAILSLVHREEEYKESTQKLISQNDELKSDLTNIQMELDSQIAIESENQQKLEALRLEKQELVKISLEHEQKLQVTTQENDKILENLFVVQEQLEKHHESGKQDKELLNSLNSEKAKLEKLILEKDLEAKKVAEEKQKDRQKLESLQSEYEQKLETEKMTSGKINLLVAEKQKLETVSKEIKQKLEITTKENEQILQNLFVVQEELEKHHESGKQDKELLKSLSSEKVKLEKLILDKDCEVEKVVEEKQKLEAVSKEIEQKLEITSQENEQILQNLFAVQEELEKQLLDKQELIKEKNDSLRYGAANIVINSFEYKFGALIMENSNSFMKLGLWTLPYKYYREYRKFKKEQKNKPELSPLETYADYYQAEQVKKHLTYYMGREVKKCFRTPLGIVIWPFALVRARKMYDQ